MAPAAGIDIVRLEAVPLSRDGFAPFGVLPPEEGDEPTADLEFRWNDGWVNYISHSRDELPDAGTGASALRCELLNRHDTHTQTLMPVSADTVMVVAPAGTEFVTARDVGAARAFVVRRGECVHLARGTWHWGPYPISAPTVRIFNVQGRGYVRDNGVAALARDLGVAIEVAPPT
jgi:ureidoglycolate hydrolase